MNITIITGPVGSGTTGAAAGLGVGGTLVAHVDSNTELERLGRTLVRRAAGKTPVTQLFIVCRRIRLYPDDMTRAFPTLVSAGTKVYELDMRYTTL